MNSNRQEIAFSNRYLYYYASLIKKLYGFVIRRGDNQPDERYIGQLGEPPQRKELTNDATPPDALKLRQEGLPAVGEIILFRFRKRLLFGYCRELFSRQVSEISVHTEDDRHLHFHKTNLVYLTGITIQNDGKELYQYANTVRILSQDIDLKTIWELASESNTPLTYQDIADLYWPNDQRDATRELALYLNLHQNCPYFTPTQNTYTPTSREEMNQRFTTQNKQKQQADEREEFIHYLQDPAETNTQSLTKHQLKWLENIRQYALWGQEAEHSKETRTLLAEVHPQTKNYKHLAYECLVDKGVWQQDEILDLHRSEIPTQFSKTEQEEAQEIFSKFDIKNRKNYHRGVFTIQDPDLPELALSYRKPLFSGPEFCVHIPDLSAIIRPDSQCDHAASERLQTLSLPDQTLPLLPQNLSFSPNQSIPTLSLIWRMDRKGRLKSFSITPATTTIQTQLSADEVDRAQHNNAHIHHRAITFFHQLANRLQDRRSNRDPDFDIPDLRLAIKNQTFQIEPIPNQLAHHIINELCILSGVATGRWCEENNLHAIFETRDPVEDIETHKEISHLIVQRHEIRRVMPNTKKTEHPTEHHALGVSVYCPITDPQNHYAHLIMQRQINHQLQHNTPYYTEDHLNTLRFQIQDMIAIANGIIYRRQRDLLLQKWENEVGQHFDATVLHIKRHGVLVELKTAPFKTIVYPGHTVAVGDEITLRLTGINLDQCQAHFTVLQPTSISQF